MLYFFSLSAISPFCVSNFTVAVFVSYFIERCSFAILVRKKKKSYTPEHVHIYLLCIIIS